VIKTFVARFMAEKAALRESFRANFPESYSGIVDGVVRLLADADADGCSPDPERVTLIDHGDYQGTQLYVIGASGYQPSTYWAAAIHYGSCSGCDTLQALRDDHGELPNETALDGVMALALQFVQRLRVISSYAMENV
jgi:hypothetical protein